MSEHDVYEYSAITEPGTIRLIRLQPSPDLEAAIQCSLIHRTLEECQDDIIDHYTALSYVWGDETDRQNIAIDGKSLDITASLDCALRHLRDETRILYAWADGVCINQKDVQDRNFQVSQMGSIYSTAHHTIIFLGPSSHESNIAMRRIASKDPAVNESDVHGNQILEEHILNRPWFTRAWILQELVLSVDPWVQTGRVLVRWDRFCHQVLRDDLVQGNIRRQRVDDMKKTRNQHKTNIETNVVTSGKFLCDMLSRRRGVGVSDPRDMVYAHLGLCDNAIQSTIPVDYDRSIADLYEHVARIHITSCRSLYILFHVEEIQPEHRRPGLPSWVPDWTVPPMTTSTRKELRQVMAPGAMGGSYTHVMFNIPHILQVSGTYRGTIQRLIPYWNDVDGSGVEGISAHMTSRDIMRWTALPESLQAFSEVTSFFEETCEKLYPCIRANGGENLYSIRVSNLNTKAMSTFFPLVSQVFASSKTIFMRSEFLIVDLATILHGMLLSVISECYSIGTAAALLDTGGIAQVPRLARIGDIVGTFDGFSETILLRPEQNIADPHVVHKREPASRVKQASKEVTNVSARFVTYGPGEWGHTNLEKVPKRGIIPEEHGVVFSIH